MSKLQKYNDNIENIMRTELKICVIGSVDAGKSSLISVLVYDGLDDGRGHARKRIFRHPHEMESGRTSAISSHHLKRDGGVVTFIDLAGHERYLKTTITGLSSSFSDYAVITIAANMGVLRMTKEHLGIALALKIPVIVVITKIDLAPEHVLNRTINRLNRILTSKAAGHKIPLPITDSSVADTYIHMKMRNKLRHVPIFQVSNKSGHNIGLLRNSILGLEPYNRAIVDDDINLFQIDERYQVTGVGTVLYGVLRRGKISVNDKLFLGPFNGQYTEVLVKSIHNNVKEHVPYLESGITGCLAIKILGKKNPIRPEYIRRGMVVISHPQSVYEFLAEVLILHHPTTIGINYQPMVHCGSVRQIVKVCKIINKSYIRTGERASIRFRFLYKPEYIEPGDLIILREGKTKGVGKIKRVFTNKA